MPMSHECNLEVMFVLKIGNPFSSFVVCGSKMYNSLPDLDNMIALGSINKKYFFPLAKHENHI